jgi:ribosomal protein S8E
MRNTDAEAKLQTDGKTKERSRRQRKRSEMDRRPQEEQHEEKENKEAVMFRTPPLNKKTVGPRSARRRRVFAEANRSLDNDRARQVCWAR